VDERLRRALERIDEENMRDPNKEPWEGGEMPSAWVYGQRMTQWLFKLQPEPSPELQIAARAQHICRWEIPRDTFPANRKGYLDWRMRMYDYHAEKTLAIMQELGYDEDAQYQVNFYLHKRCLATNREVQYLEDCACLIFIEHQLLDFAREHREQKVLRIIQKTWDKMTEQGHREVYGLDLSEEAHELLDKVMRPR
jgi:hypothetical protein